MAPYLDSTQLYDIASERLRAQFCPGLGGRMLKFLFDGTDIVVPAEPHRFEVTQWPRAGAYPLIPYHNRLADAAIAVEGKVYRLAAHPAAEPHTLHGPGHTRPWHVVSHDASRLVMKTACEPDEHWPWAYEAVQDFQVEGDVLELSISLKNVDSRPMPAGIGWHPYFSSKEPAVTDARIRWPHRADYLPTGERTEIEDPVPRREPPTSYLENWSKAEIVIGGGAHVSMTAASPFDYLVIHRGDPANICVEPVTHVPNAWNLPHPTTGARILLPGEALEGRVTVKMSR